MSDSARYKAFVGAGPAAACHDSCPTHSGGHCWHQNGAKGFQGSDEVSTPVVCCHCGRLGRHRSIYPAVTVTKEVDASQVDGDLEPIKVDLSVEEVDAAAETYPRVVLTFQRAMNLTLREAQIAATVCTGLCHACFEADRSCQCWNDE